MESLKSRSSFTNGVPKYTRCVFWDWRLTYNVPKLPARNVFFKKKFTLFYVKTFKTTCLLGTYSISNALDLEKLSVRIYKCHFTGICRHFLVTPRTCLTFQANPCNVLVRYRINKYILTGPTNCDKATRHHVQLSLCAKSRKTNDAKSRKWPKTSIWAIFWRFRGQMSPNCKLFWKKGSIQIEGHI